MDQQNMPSEAVSDDECLVTILEQAKGLDPEFAVEALDLLQAFLNTCKNMHGNLAGMPYSVEVLMKLSQSIASLRLSDKVRVPDVIVESRIAKGLPSILSFGILSNGLKLDRFSSKSWLTASVVDKCNVDLLDEDRAVAYEKLHWRILKLCQAHGYL
eukprot:751472-Hanusia_phi.AAC.6